MVLRKALRGLSRRPWLLALIIVVAVGTPGYVRLEMIAEQGRSNQVQNCENANEQRAATLTLWEFIFDYSGNDPDDPRTPQEQEQIQQIRDWVAQLYKPRDCTDLGREYDIPSPPPILNGHDDS